MRTFPPQEQVKNFHHGTERIQSEVNEEKGPEGNERTKASKVLLFTVLLLLLKRLQKK
jgi:hypothetical protein